MIESIWIIGIGPVLVNKQFKLDLHRLYPAITFNDAILPNNIYDSIRLLYDTCGIHYYSYTKYLNQTMGNFMMEHLSKLYPNKHIIRIPHTYKVNAYYKPTEKYIDAFMDSTVLNYDTTFFCTIRCCCKYLLDDERFIIRIAT